MNFKGHITGGTLAGVGVAGLAIVSGYSPLNQAVLQQFIETPFSLDNSITTLAGLFLITCFMSLFPDLDTTSIPQRWFYRLLFVCQGVLYYQKKLDWFALLAFLSILPVVHKHRGWTHWKITPWLISVFLAAVYEYFQVRDAWFREFNWENVLQFLQIYWMYACACIIGHYTHLLLDSKSPLLTFLRNDKNHH